MAKKELSQEPVDAIPPYARVRLNEGSRFVLAATKEDVISSHPIFARYKTDSFNLTARFRPPHFVCISTS